MRRARRARRLAEALRRRWVATGVLFGVAFLCKQFALLPLVAVLVAVPGWRARARVAVPAAGRGGVRGHPLRGRGPVGDVEHLERGQRRAAW